jgi:nitroimidazol reductase NimA-like FMN-containing flavoprotein (pyridoxamine 5'-phosphate oxidase superfamily)
MTTVITAMTAAQCRQHLAGESVGRVGVTAHALPVIIPVNYALDDDTIVFRTAPDGLLAHACDETVVAFEVDRLSPDGSDGWSVLVVGVAQLVPDHLAQRAGRDLPAALGPGQDQLVTIATARITGRQVERQPVTLDIAGRAS